ncbi:GRIP and coiled-coil domain-containing protein 1 [Phlebotomus argentipes]|uniref:GRIP and coiled-coil domain-containing protein 1 n=1 Tax=Phlebotomus argentipes TaxID=94469 RepID=UPI002892C2B4|nr:GRIP and coiled-coil domain-containing protein 1 [Phlebotomus argentipes]
MAQNAKELEKVIGSQREQLTRYETRLKDVVAAYKGLLKEKEALEVSLSALSKKDTTHENGKPDGATADGDNLQMQIATLMSSLATLSAEKSRMEASFQADKKLLRQEIQQKDVTLREMQEKLKAASTQSNFDVETVKSKLIVERHEREKETNDNMMMVRELQKLLSDERHLKENLEMQINDLKNQFATTNYSDKTIKDLNSELDAARKKIKKLEKSENVIGNESSAMVLQQLQNEIAFLKQQHSVAIKSEQKRALVAEERTKKLEALHEERVASLESRLAELSKTVGNYDRLRQQDQDNIHKLKERIAQFDNPDPNALVREDQAMPAKNVNEIVDEIVRLKKILTIENAKIPNPIDVSRIFATSANDHGVCMEEQVRLRRDLENCQMDNLDLKKSVEVHKSHIHTLQEKVKVLNRNIDEQEMELKAKATDHAGEIRAQKGKWREATAALEADYRSRIAELEQHLQKQRDRSLVLLEEKENEIRALRTSFNIFMPPGEDSAETSSQGSSEQKPQGTVLTTPGGSNVEEYHMLHYVHELARKDVEISALRKAKHSAESSLRQALQDKVSTQEELHDKISQLEENVDRLERCKSREGANLEYLKNVTLSFLATNDNVRKRHMLNAIGAVLKFSPIEMKSINNYFTKKL